MPRYKWSHPAEWLEDTPRSFTNSELISIIATSLDSDQIQDIFQTEMEADGYFVDLDAPEPKEEDSEKDEEESEL